MDYAAVVEALYERHRSVRDAGFSGAAYKPGLEAMLSYAAFLGHPEREFRSVHVAGTNGKGSVGSMLAAALAARGLRVGLYTSPHLVDFRERIKIIAAPGTPSPSPLGVQGDSWYKTIPANNNAGDSCLAAEGDTSPSPLGVQGDSWYKTIPREAFYTFMEHFDRDGLTFFEVTTGMAVWAGVWTVPTSLRRSCR